MPTLSPLKVLRSLQVEGWVGCCSMVGDDRNTRVMKVFSTIASPVFAESVVVITGGYCCWLPQDVSLFQTLRRMNEAIFKLVFLLEDSDPLPSGVRQKLAKALEIATADGLLDFLDSPPIARVVRSRYCDWDKFSV